MGRALRGAAGRQSKNKGVGKPENLRGCAVIRGESAGKTGNKGWERRKITGWIYLVVMVSVSPETVPWMPSVLSRLAGT